MRTNRGIIHRDLKGDNVVVTADQRVKVLDFGLALRLPKEMEASISSSESTVERTDSGHTVAGTLAYMAPEILRGGKTPISRPTCGRSASFSSVGASVRGSIAGR